MGKQEKKVKEIPPELSAEQKKIGNKLKKLRKDKGYSSPDIFAYEHNINRSQYGKYEAGSEDIRLSSLIKVIHLFDLTLNEFFDEEYEKG